MYVLIDQIYHLFTFLRLHIAYGSQTGCAQSIAEVRQLFLLRTKSYQMSAETSRGNAAASDGVLLGNTE